MEESFDKGLEIAIRNRLAPLRQIVVWAVVLALCAKGHRRRCQRLENCSTKVCVILFYVQGPGVPLLTIFLWECDMKLCNGRIPQRLDLNCTFRRAPSPSCETTLPDKFLRRSATSAMPIGTAGLRRPNLLESWHLKDLQPPMPVSCCLRSSDAAGSVSSSPEGFQSLETVQCLFRSAEEPLQHASLHRNIGLLVKALPYPSDFPGR